MEPNLKNALYERNHRLDDIFTISTLQMRKKVKKDKTVGEVKNKVDNEKSEPLEKDGVKIVNRTGVGLILVICMNIHLIFIQVFCNDCDGLVQEALKVRGHKPHDSTVLVGLDDGQSIMKICTTIQGNMPDPNATVVVDEEMETDHHEGRSSYAEVYYHS